jgi:hypothetical protein
LILVTILLFTTCKKGNNTKPSPPLLDVVGKWSLYSWQQTGINANAAQFPCLADNILQINADNTTNASYIGTDTCFTVRPTGPLSTWTAIGIPGQAANASTWRRNGNNVYIGSQHYVLSNSGNQLYLTATDTINGIYNPPLIVKTVNIKVQ